MSFLPLGFGGINCEYIWKIFTPLQLARVSNMGIALCVAENAGGQ
jgi:hypothetical protein